MKKIFFLAFFGTFLIIALLFRVELSNSFNKYIYFSPCDEPIFYSVGRIDAQFNLSKEEVIRRAKNAENIWEIAASRNLFEYDPKSSFTINVSFDERQNLSSKANQLDNELKVEKNEIQQRITKYEQDINNFKKGIDELNSDINYWNSQGGAPEDEYKNLIARQENLKAEQERLKIEANNLNLSTNSFNSQANILNITIDKLNSALSQRPEGGVYYQHGNDKNITIYFNNSEKEFIYTLAHEFGHSLGIGHVADENSIMYPKVNEVLIPSVYDLQELEKACSKKNIFTPFFERFNTLIRQTSGN